MPPKTRDNKMWSFSRSSDQVHAGLACDGSWFTLSRHAYVSVTTLYRKNYAHWSLLQEEMNSGGPCITTIRHSVDVTLSSLLMLDSTLMTHHQALSNTMVNMHLVWAGDWIRKFDLDFKFPIVNQWTQSCLQFESSSSKRDENPARCVTNQFMFANRA